MVASVQIRSDDGVASVPVQLPLSCVVALVQILSARLFELLFGSQEAM